MPKEIKTTLAVDGEAAFKRAINDATTSLRNMGTQLTLAQAEFQKDGDAMKLMTTRSKTLRSEIDQQEKIVSALEKAVSDSAKAFGENSAKTEKWQADLNRAKAKLVGLQNELTLNEQGLDRNGKAFDDSAQAAADYQATLEGIGKNVSFEAVTNGLGRINDTVGNVIKKILNLGKTIRDTFVEAGNWADDLMTDATRYGMDVETLQRWRNAADFIDTDVETIINAKQKLNTKMVNGWKDGEMDVWQMLGVDVKDANGYRDQMDVLWEVGEVLQHMTEYDGNDVRASQYAMEVFGKSWKDMLPLFNAGRKEWEDTVAEQKVVSKEHVKNLATMDDANQRLANSWETLKYSFLAEIAPTVTEITDALANLLDEFNEWMETEEGKKAMADLSAAIQELFSGLKDVSFKDAVAAAGNALNGIKDAFLWLNKHKGEVVTALEIIGIGFAGMKLAEVALNVGQIVSGFQTLWKGANKKMPTMPGADGTGSGTGTATGTGTAGGGLRGWFGKYLPGIKDLAGGLGTEAGVTALAVLPALIEQAKDVEKWREEQETRLRAAEEMALQGSENAEFVRQAAEATGLVRDENGNEKKNILGQSYTQMTDSHYDLLMGLQSRQGAEKAKLALALQGSSTAGDDTWQLLQRFWGGAALDPYVVDELLENVTDALIEQEKRGLPSMRPGKWTPPAAEPEPEDLTPRGILTGLSDEMTDAQREAAEAWWDEWRKEPGSDEADAAYENLKAVFSGNEDLLDRLNDAIDEWFEGFEDHEYLDTENLLSDAISEMKVNTAAAKTAAESVSTMDLKRFNAVPGNVEASAERGVRSGISGLRVTIDGETAGRILAPYVSQYIARAI